MKRKLAAIWRILTYQKYLLVTMNDVEDGVDIFYDYTMSEPGVKMTTGHIYRLLDEQDKTLEAFKEMLN